MIKDSETDEDAKRELEQFRMKQKASRERQKVRHLARMENDPEYRRQWQDKQDARCAASCLKAKQMRDDLKERAKTDPIAAEQLEALHAKEREKMRQRNVMQGMALHDVSFLDIRH